MVDNDLSLVEFIDKAIGDVAPERVHVGVEDRNNVVSDELLRRGFRVFTANPKQVDRFRERETTAGAKDDRRDASVIANALATDERLFHEATPETASVIELRGLTSTLHGIDADFRALSNQVVACVQRYFPMLLTLCAGADEPWFWELLLRLGDVESAKRVRHATIAALLKRHRLRKMTVAKIVAVIEAPQLKPSTTIATAERTQVESLLKRLTLVTAERRRLGMLRDALINELKQPNLDGTVSDMALLLSMPGVGPATGAALYLDALPLLLKGELKRLRGQSGVAPITKQSGKARPDIRMRFACSARLREAFHHASNTASRSGRFKTKYDGLKAKNHQHARALRGVADLMAHVLIAMFKTRTPFVDGHVAAG